MKPHAVIDIETLDTVPSAHLLSVGAVRFNPMNPNYDDFTSIHLHFNKFQPGRTASQKTIEWWGNQSKEACSNVTQTGVHPSKFPTHMQNLEALKNFLQGVGLIWAKPPSFDRVILDDFHSWLDVPTPWTFRQWYDVRTLELITSEIGEIQFEGVKHLALDDARHEGKMVKKFYELTNS